MEQELKEKAEELERKRIAKENGEVQAKPEPKAKPLAAMSLAEQL